MVAFLFYAPGFTGLRGFRNTPEEALRFIHHLFEGTTSCPLS